MESIDLEGGVHRSENRNSGIQGLYVRESGLEIWGES